MSGYEQGGEDSSAGAAAAPVPTAGEEQQSKRHALEEKMRKLEDAEADILQLKTEIASDKAEADKTKNEGLELERRRAIAANSERLRGLEARRDRLEAQIDQLLALAEQPTAAGGRSPTLCLPLRTLIGLPRRGIARAPLATRI